MATTPMADEWTEKMVQDPAARTREFRLARVTETVFSLLGTGCMFVAVWGFTAHRPALGGVDQYSLAGMALLCFNGCMMIAASGGIRRRLICLVQAIDTRPR